MSVTIRPYVNGGWEVDIRVELPDGTDIRERKKAPSLSKTAAQRWAEARERVLLVEGKAAPIKKEEVQEKPTLREFAPRFIDGYATATWPLRSGTCISVRPRLMRRFGSWRRAANSVEEYWRRREKRAEEMR